MIIIEVKDEQELVEEIISIMKRDVAAYSAQIDRTNSRTIIKRAEAAQSALNNIISFLQNSKVVLTPKNPG